MYILYKLEKRAETTDTILFLVSNDRSTLEEILLSLYNDLIDAEIKYFEKECFMTEENLDMEKLEDWCRLRMRDYDIIYVPYIE